MKKISLFIFLALCTTWVQAKVVKGTVTDQAGETIISASVVVKGTSVGTIKNRKKESKRKICPSTLVRACVRARKYKVSKCGNWLEKRKMKKNAFF